MEQSATSKINFGFSFLHFYVLLLTILGLQRSVLASTTCAFVQDTVEKRQQPGARKPGAS